MQDNKWVLLNLCGLINIIIVIITHNKHCKKQQTNGDEWNSSNCIIIIF